MTGEQLSVRLEVWAFYQGSISSLAETLNDLEQIRIATTHRIGAINRQLGRDSDARVVDDRETERLWELADKLKGVENDAVKELEKLMKQHPLGEWVAATKGCGLKQIARLLAATGNPYWNAKAGRPRRGPAEFWAYCGYSVLPASPHSIRDAHGGPAGGQSPQVTQAHTDTHNGDGDLQSLPASQTTADPQTVPAGGQSPATSQTPREAQESPAGGQPLAPDQAGIDAHGPSVGGDSLHPTDQFPGDALDGPVGGVAQRRQKGQRSNWNNQAKMRAYLVAGSCVKAKAISPYGPLYDAARTKYATAVHAEECSQCGVCATCGKRLGKTKEEHLASTNCPKRVPRPAPAGSPLSPGHQHQRAERIVAKEILKDLYLQAKAWHEREPEDE